MATVTNNFNTGLAAGTAITTANSDDNGAGNALDLIGSSGGGGTQTFETRDAGLYGLFTSIGSGQSYAEYSTSVGSVAAGGAVYGSADVLIPVLPGAGLGGSRIALIMTAADGFIAEWRINDTGKLEQRTGAGALVNTSVNSITAGQWFKVHISILNISATVGQLQCRLFLDPASNSPTETLTSAANLNLGSTAAAKYRWGVTRTFASFATGVDNVRWSTTSQLPVEAGLLLGPIAGGLTDDGFTVSYRTSDSAGQDHRLVVSLTDDLASPVYSSAVVPDTDGFAKVSISGLDADTVYFYGLEVGGILLPTGRGQIRTDPAQGAIASYSVAFGSCQYDTPTTGTFEAIRTYEGSYGQVRRLIHMGDLNYRDWGADSVATIVAQHQTSLGSAVMAPLLSEVAMTYAWDNHDWGGSFSDKDDAAATNVPAVYRKVFPSYTLPASDGKGIWHSWVIGRVRFIQIDPRSQRDAYNAPNGPSKTMLGAEQKAWFKARLQDPEPVKIICGNMYWRHDAALGDRWGSYPDEFNELNSFIDTSAIGEVYVIFGDRHALTADNGTAPETRGRPQAGGAPFQQGSTAVSETWSQGYYASAGTMHAFGLLHITDTGSTITIDYEGKTSGDMITRVSMSTVFQVDQQLAPPSIAPVAALGTPTVTKGAVNLAVTGIATSEAFGLPTAYGGTTFVTATGIGSDAAFGTPTATVQQIVTVPSIAPVQAFGVPAVTTGPVAATATSIDGGEAFGQPDVNPGPVTLTPAGIGSNVALGVPLVETSRDQFLTATGIASSLGFGVVAVEAPIILQATSVGDGAAVGSPYVSPGPVGLTVAGIGSAAAFGTPVAATGEITIEVQSVGSGLAWGRPTVTAGTAPAQTIAATGVASELMFGLPGRIVGSVTVRATTIPAVDAFGVPSASVGMVVLTATGVASGEEFGDTHIIGGNDGQVVFASSVPSGEAFGSEVLAFTGGGGNDCECAVLVGH